MGDRGAVGWVASVGGAGGPRSGWLGLLLVCMTTLLSGCFGPPGLPELLEEPRTVEASVEGRWAVPALLPTDVGVLGERVVVLDSHGGRLLAVGAEGAAVLREDGELLGGATRLAPAEDGLWVVHPDGLLVRLDAAGEAVERVVVSPGGAGRECRPVGVVEAEDDLVVGCVDGRVLEQPRDGGPAELLRTVPQAAAVGALLTDLRALPGGGLAAVDLHQPGLHLLGAEPGAVQSVGRHGLWVDAWSQPRAVAPAAGGALVVADRELSVVQALRASDGQPLGALAEAGELLRPQAPVAVRPGPRPDTLLVLQGAPAEVWTVRLGAAAVAQADALAETRALRHMLASPRGAGAAQTCAQCHDGVVTDGREVFDPERGAHPVDLSVDPDHVDAALPLGPEHALQCTTCHSPHGGDGPTSFLRDGAEADELCVRCHTENAHEQAIVRSGLPGGVHPSGPAAAAEPGTSIGETGCTTCHAPHGAEAAPLLRHADDDQGCVGCHGDQANPRRTHPAPAATTASPGGCRACHDLVGGQGEALVRTPGGGCGDCHGAVSTALTQGHGKLARQGDAGCGACHGVHGAPARSALLLAPSAPCQSCHAEQHAAGPHQGPDAPGCTDCHGAHDAATVVQTCSDCHAEQHARTAVGEHRAVACVDCHPAHGAGPPADGGCASCHQGPGASATAVPAWDHPPLAEGTQLPRWDALAGLLLYDEHGRVAAAPDGGALTCRSCHWTHGAPPDAGRGLLRAGTSTACAACHGDEALLLLRGYHQPRGGTP